MKEKDYPPYPAVINDDSLYQHVQRVGRLLLGPENVKRCNKVMVGEDFTFYQKSIPGFMLGIGI